MIADVADHGAPEASSGSTNARIGHESRHPWHQHHMTARRLGIDTYQEMVAYIHSDCHICRSEGFEALSRIEVWHGERRIIATLNVVHFPLIAIQEIGLSEAAWRSLRVADGDTVMVKHPTAVESFSHVRGKIYGTPIGQQAADTIIADVVAGLYSDMEMAALVTACSGTRMDIAETTAVTRSMIYAGKLLKWDFPLVVDKHCVGGIPGNRTTPIVVSIVAACGLTIPKTSSRAITSPAGTADTMETMAPVDLDVNRMRKVVEQEGGCIIWGGAVSLSPADDVLIRAERPLGFDSDGLLVASILSKKIAAGSTHVLIDIPVGRTAKVRSADAAELLRQRLFAVAQQFGLSLQVHLSDGTQPVGRGIGPALEAWDVLAVLQRKPDAPSDLRKRALTLAGLILEMGGKAPAGGGWAMAEKSLDSGAAWSKFQAICDAQGGMRTPPRATHTHVICALHSGVVVAIDNRKLASLAKLAGAPKAPSAGIEIYAPLGGRIRAGQPYLSIHAESSGELDYARSYAETQDNLISIKEEL